MLGERPAGHVFHRQKGLALLCGAGLVEPGDVRMLQRAQDVALALEALVQPPLLQAWSHQFKRHLAAQRAVSPLGQPDHAHAALAQRPQQAVGADGLACAKGRRRAHRIGDGPAQRRGPGVARANARIVAVQQAGLSPQVAQGRRQRRVLTLQRIDPGGLLGGGQRQHPHEQAVQRCQLVGAQGHLSLSSSPHAAAPGHAATGA